MQISRAPPEAAFAAFAVPPRFAYHRPVCKEATDLAVATGAEIVWPLESPEYGGVFFACRDPEGHIWNVGSYDPWEAPQ